MAKTSKRAERRHQTKRLQKKRRDYWGTKGEEKTDGERASVANTPTPCSCEMCCNVRKSSYAKGDEKLSIQERKQKQETINELLISALTELRE